MERSAPGKREFEPNEATRHAWAARAHLLQARGSERGSEQAGAAFDAARSSFEEVVRLTEPALLKRALLGTSGHLEDAQDLLQELYIKAFRALPGLRGDSQVETWLYKGLIRKLADYYRERSNRIGEYDIDGEMTADHLYSIISDIQTDPAHRTIHTETLERVIDELSDLTPDSRRVVFLRYVMDFSHSEISRVLGIHKNNSKILAKRGLDRLRDKRR